VGKKVEESFADLSAAELGTVEHAAKLTLDVASVDAGAPAAAHLAARDRPVEEGDARKHLVENFGADTEVATSVANGEDAGRLEDSGDLVEGA
jgi:hypothetical protein